MFVRRSQARNRVSGEPDTTCRLVQTARLAGAAKQTTLLNLGRRFAQAQTLFGFGQTITRHDFTNTYFELVVAGVLKAKRGRSKECRIDCPLLTLAMRARRQQLAAAQSGVARRSANGRRCIDQDSARHRRAGPRVAVLPFAGAWGQEHGNAHGAARRSAPSPGPSGSSLAARPTLGNPIRACIACARRWCSKTTPGCGAPTPC